MAQQRGMPLPPASGDASLLSHSCESQLKKRKSVYSMSSAYPRIDFHNIDFSLVLADVGMATEKARKAHRPNLLAKALRLYDMFTVAMTQQALLLDQTSECSCASATSCCVCGHADDAAS